MSERTCPKCGSGEHFMQYGLCGTSVTCECGTVLAARGDPDWAPLDHPDPEAWADERTWVLPGAEAKDPQDDKLFTPRRTT